MRAGRNSFAPSPPRPPVAEANNLNGSKSFLRRRPLSQSLRSLHLLLTSNFYLLTSPLLPLSKSRSLFLLLFTLSFLPTTLFPAILTVKPDGTGNHTIIQEAIDAAAMHDTVLVWPGIYYENLHIDAKPITLASLYRTTGEKQYIYQTIIDGSTIQNSVIVADNFPEGEWGTICGFTIRNGDARNNWVNFPSNYRGKGGGLLFDHANMNVEGCLIQKNLAFRFGGGIYTKYAVLFLSKTTIRNNIANQRGGGLCCVGGNGLTFDTIQLNSIYFNHSILGNDFYKHISLDFTQYVVDSATTISDHGYCLLNVDDFGSPVYDIELIANHAMIDQVEADVFVNPDGSNSNSGLSSEEPLRNIWYAMTKINPDTNNRRKVYILPGTYSPSVNGEIFPINARSNTTIEGADMNTCILDAEQNWFHYSAHSASYSLTLKKLKLINGNSFIDDYYTYSGAIHLDRTYYDIQLQDITIENCIGMDAGGAEILSRDWISLENIHTKNNKGGFSFSTYYTDQPIRHAIIAKNCSFQENSYYMEDFGSGGGYVSGNSYIQTNPLISTTAGILISKNESRDFWGGLQQLATFGIGGGVNNITNVTIADNINKNNLPGSYTTLDNMTSRFYNSIIFGNEHPSIVLVAQPPVGEPGVLYIDYSLIEQGLDDIWNQQNFNILHYGVNNIEGNPMFKGEGEHPYELLPESPCINTGTPMYEEGMEPPYIKEEDGKYILYTHEYDTIHLPETDIAGNPRIAYGRIDMGAYEFVDTTVNIGQRPPKYLGGEIKVIPNPFEYSTAIKFTLLKKGHCVVKIHDLKGRPVKTLLDTFTIPGNFEMRWHSDFDNGNKIPSGHYIISVILDGENVGSVKVRRW